MYTVQSAETGPTNISLLSNHIPAGLCGTKSLFSFLLRIITKVQCREERKPTRPVQRKTQILVPEISSTTCRTKHLSMMLMVSHA